MGEEIRVIEYHMMDKERYFSWALVNGVCIRVLTYPSMLVKTRLQIQSGQSIYSGTLDAFSKISRCEGVTGLYRGFWVSSLQLLPHLMYLSTYEGTRHWLTKHLGVNDHNVKLAVGGFVATVVGQTVLVPIEIVMQHLMLMGNATAATTTASATSATSSTTASSTTARTHINPSTTNKPSSSTSSSATANSTSSSSSSSSSINRRHTLSRYTMTGRESRQVIGPLKAVVRGVYTEGGGVRGFYQGFWAAVFCHGPFNSLFWLSFHHTTDLLTSLLPDWVPRMAVISVAAPLGGITAAFVTNPLDVIRARIQVDGTKTREAITTLWKEEGIKLLTKGASARVISLGTHSLFTFVGYETIKRWSVLDEYRDGVRW